MGFFKAFLCFFALLIFLPFLSVSSTDKQTYIVHMKHQDKPFLYATHHDWYSAQLRSLFDSDFSILYTYTDSFYGFAAKLDSDQAESLRRSDLVLGVYEDTLYPLLTTRTSEFLDLYTESSQNTQFLEQASHDVIGPNKVTPYILKPDVIGPGVNILAARPEAVVPTRLYTDTRKTQFNVISGSE